MIYSIEGKLEEVRDDFLALLAGQISFKVFSNKSTISRLSPGEKVKLFCFLYFREDKFFELYGFLEKESVSLFEMLNSVSGIGPKTALNILELGSASDIASAIIEKKPELLTRVGGIGRKTAERVILELHNKIKLAGGASSEKLKKDLELEEVLLGLGYSRSEVRKALKDKKMEGTIEERLRQALKELGRRS